MSTIETTRTRSRRPVYPILTEAEILTALLRHEAGFSPSELSFSILLIVHHQDGTESLDRVIAIIASALLTLRPMLPTLQGGATFGHQTDDTVTEVVAYV
jgi:hypothetical protein